MKVNDHVFKEHLPGREKTVEAGLQTWTKVSGANIARICKYPSAVKRRSNSGQKRIP